jgi:hypothetical protein
MSTYTSQIAAVNVASSIMRIENDLPKVLNALTIFLLRILLLPIYPLFLLVIYLMDREIQKSARSSIYLVNSGTEYKALRAALSELDKLIQRMNELDIDDSDDSWVAKKFLQWKTIFESDRDQIVNSLKAIDQKAVAGDPVLEYIPEDQVWTNRSKGYEYRF